MSELTFHIIDDAKMRLYHTWFEDAELSRRIEAPTQQWLDYVSTTPGCYAWMIYDGSIAVGQLQFGPYADCAGSLSLVVNPKLRNQGYGKKILKTFLKRPELKNFDRLEGTIEPDNIASLRCVRQVGFIQTSLEPDEEGFLHFTYDLIQFRKSEL